eukprot:TRINITY_DN26386_c0_g1_i1.p1 TRINITY_DN26386_c0_g1~~TRINITY_DN26386_c0_g1_i1.p1  ORF type:complete len:554 (+),score=131.24 TRINITY_DN26386_c0_g1_i1:41-1702(+)
MVDPAERYPIAPVSSEASLDASSEVNVGCMSCMQAARSHLQVCLKLLALLHRSCSKSLGSGQAYLAIVMLNASLLKGLHVTDSFQAHCHRECPKACNEDEDEAEASFERELLGEDVAGYDDSSTVDGTTYRRLQAQCVVMGEAARSLEIELASDEARIAALESECQKLREKLAAQSAEASGYRAARRSLPEASPEVLELKSLGLAAEPVAGGGAFLSERSLQCLAAEVENLNNELREANKAADVAEEQANAACQRAADASQEREELRQLLQPAFSEGSSDDIQALKAAVKRLVTAATSAARSGSEPGTPRHSSDAEDLEQITGGVQYHDPSPSPKPIDARIGGGPDNKRHHMSKSASQDQINARKPLTGGSSTPSNHKAPGRRTAAYGAAVMEETQLTKAALRCAKHPGDVQAWGKLQSLLGGGASGSANTGSAGRQMKTSASSGSLPAAEPASHASLQQLQSQQRPISPCAAVPSVRYPVERGAATSQAGVLESPGPRARGSMCAVPQWATARMTWPTPEQRAQMLMASSAAPGRGGQPSHVPVRQATTGRA